MWGMAPQSRARVIDSWALPKLGLRDRVADTLKYVNSMIVVAIRVRVHSRRGPSLSQLDLKHRAPAVSVAPVQCTVL